MNEKRYYHDIVRVERAEDEKRANELLEQGAELLSIQEVWKPVEGKDEARIYVYIMGFRGEVLHPLPLPHSQADSQPPTTPVAANRIPEDAGAYTAGTTAPPPQQTPPPASMKQIMFIKQLSKSDPEYLKQLLSFYGKTIDQLNVKEASAVIDELKKQPKKQG